MTERDPALERAWREHSDEMPPPALDRAILAAAHRAVGSRPQEAKPAEATSPQRWWMPLAAAAAIGTVVVGILQTMPADTNLVLSEPSSSGKLAATAPANEVAPAVATPRGESAPATSPAPAQDAPARTTAAPQSAGSPADAGGSRALAEKKKQEADVRTKQATAPAESKRDVVRMQESTPSSSAAPRQAPAPMVTPAPAFAPPAPPAAPPAVNRADVATDAGRTNGAAAPEPFPAAAPAAKARSALAATAPSESNNEASGTDAGVARKDAAAEAPMPAAGAAAAAHGRLGQSAAAPSPAPLRMRDEARESAAKPLAKAVSLDAQAKARDPDAWIARIRKLRDEGSTADAIRELREFRDAVPDAERRLPADLRDWSASLGPAPAR